MKKQYIVSDYICSRQKLILCILQPIDVCDKMYNFIFQFWWQALLPDDMAKSVEFVLATPPHVQVNLDTLYWYSIFQYLSYA